MLSPYLDLKRALGSEPLGDGLRSDILAEHHSAQPGTHGRMILDRIYTSMRAGARFSAHLRLVEDAMLRTQTRPRPEPPKKFARTCAPHARTKRWHWRIRCWMTAGGYTGALEKVLSRPGNYVYYGRPAHTYAILDSIPLRSARDGRVLEGYNRPEQVTRAFLRFHGRRIKSGHILHTAEGSWLVRRKR